MFQCFMSLSTQFNERMFPLARSVFDQWLFLLNLPQKFLT